MLRVWQKNKYIHFQFKKKNYLNIYFSCTQNLHNSNKNHKTPKKQKKKIFNGDLLNHESVELDLNTAWVLTLRDTEVTINNVQKELENVDNMQNGGQGGIVPTKF